MPLNNAERLSTLHAVSAEILGRCLEGVAGTASHDFPEGLVDQAGNGGGLVAARTDRGEGIGIPIDQRQVEILQGAARRQPNLKVLTLDYWDPADADGIASLYRSARSAGFVSYVATIELDRLVAEPR